MSIRKRKNARIEYGKVEVSDEELAPRAVRRRISIMIPEDVLGRLNDMAKAEAMGYQTLVNRILREATEGESISARLERIERAVMRATR
jgi:uncharacterized protein (DUF4415 family)